jgi:hypothetical protein
MWRHVVWYINVSEERRASMFYREDGSSGFSEMFVPIYQTTRRHVSEILTFTAIWILSLNK